MSRKRKKVAAKKKQHRQQPQIPGINQPRQPKPSAEMIERRQRMVAQVNTLMQKATFHHQRGELPAAMRFYRQALTIQPTNVTALNNLGLIRKSLGEPRVAEEPYYSVDRGPYVGPYVAP